MALSTNPYMARLALLILIAGLLCFPARLEAQPGAQGNAFSAPRPAKLPARVLRVETVRQELERRLARNPGNEAAIWNIGYEFFRLYPPTQDTAWAIHQAFLTTRTNDPNQRQILLKAAIYWEKIHDYGIGNVPAGQDFQTRDKTYYGKNDKAGTMPMRSQGSRHQNFTNYFEPGRNLEKVETYRGRSDNPYPGNYYPGVYPP